MRIGALSGRHARAAAALAAVLAPAALLAGCGSSSNSSASSASSSAPPKISPADLARAADVSTKVAGFKLVMTLQENLPGAGSISMNGSGSFQNSHSGSMNLDLSVPQAAAIGLGHMQMSIVLANGTMYMKMPAALASKLPGGKQWMSIDLAQVMKLGGGGAGLSSLTSSDSQMSDPTQYFTWLRAVSAGSIESLGTATIDGVQTTHYHADVDISKLTGAVPAAQRPAIQKLMSQLSKISSTSALPIDVWIDSSDFVRQIVLTENLMIKGHAGSVAVQEDFPEYGPQPAPPIPPADQTMDLSSLAGGVL